MDVAAGDTRRIEYLYGADKRLTKTGAGRLEVAVIGNTNISVAVQDGTFAFVRPERMSFAADANVLFHVDATAAESMDVEEIDGTNYVKTLRDADGKTVLKAVPHATRPRPYLTADGMNGLPVLDFGALQNAGGKGYGAALTWERADGADPATTAFCEYLFAWEDDPEAKNHTGSYRGPSLFGVANVSKMMTRDLCGGGLTASLHPAAAMGRLQLHNYLDGTLLDNHFYRIPDGPHVFWQWTTGEAYPCADVTGFGFNTSSSAYGGFRLAEFIITEKFLDAATRARVQAYLLSRWLGPTVKRVTMASGATLDVSATAATVADLDLAGGTVTGWDNLRIGFVGAGTTARTVAAAAWTLTDRAAGATPNLSFAGDATLAAPADTTGAVARVEGAGALRKTGAGVAVVGVLGEGLTALDVQEGTLRLAPLESPGLWLRLDASQTDTLTTETVDGVDYVARWVDANGRAVAATPTGANYTFDSTRTVARPFVTTADGLHDLPAVDFGAYTSADYPDGDGAQMLLSPALTGSTLEDPGAQDVFAVWMDRPEAAALPGVDGLPVVGPSLFGNSSYWWRGLGGAGRTFPLHQGDVATRMGGDLRLDGVLRDFKTHLPSAGWHLLDQRIAYAAGAPVQYLGGSADARVTNKVTYVNHTDVPGWTPTVKGVYGGLRFGELVVCQRVLPDRDRDVLAAALGAKWFNRAHPYAFDAVALADGAALETPYAQVSVKHLHLGGATRLAGALTLPDNARVTLAGGAADGFPALEAASLTLGASVTVALSVADGHGLAHRDVRLVATASVAGDVGAVRVTGVEAFGLRASAVCRDDGLWLTFEPGGTCILIR